MSGYLSQLAQRSAVKAEPEAPKALVPRQTGLSPNSFTKRSSEDIEIPGEPQTVRTLPDEGTPAMKPRPVTTLQTETGQPPLASKERPPSISYLDRHLVRKRHPETSDIRISPLPLVMPPPTEQRASRKEKPSDPSASSPMPPRAVRSEIQHPPEPRLIRPEQETPNVTQQKDPAPLQPVIHQLEPRLLQPEQKITPLLRKNSIKGSSPRLSIGRITVEVLPPTTTEVEAVHRKPAVSRKADSKKAYTGFNKLTFGLGQL